MVELIDPTFVLGGVMVHDVGLYVLLVGTIVALIKEVEALDVIS